MAEIDRAKEYIGFLKVVFVTFVAIDTSLISWLFNHSELTFKSMLVISGIGTFTLGIILLFRKILKKINALEDMT